VLRRRPAWNGDAPRVRGHPSGSGPSGDLRTMVAAAWDLAAVEEQYEQFHRGVPRPGARRRAGPAGRAGARLARVPVHRPGTARELLPGPLERAWKRAGCSPTAISAGPAMPAWSGSASTASADPGTGAARAACPAGWHPAPRLPAPLSGSSQQKIYTVVSAADLTVEDRRGLIAGGYQARPAADRAAATALGPGRQPGLVPAAPAQPRGRGPGRGRAHVRRHRCCGPTTTCRSPTTGWPRCWCGRPTGAGSRKTLPTAQLIAERGLPRAAAELPRPRSARALSSTRCAARPSGRPGHRGLAAPAGTGSTAGWPPTGSATRLRAWALAQDPAAGTGRRR